MSVLEKVLTPSVSISCNSHLLLMLFISSTLLLAMTIGGTARTGDGAFLVGEPAFFLPPRLELPPPRPLEDEFSAGGSSASRSLKIVSPVTGS